MIDNDFPSEELIDNIIKVVTSIKYKEKMEVDVSFVSIDVINELNRDYREIDKPTDVLSFSLKEGEFSDISGNVLGDVIICKEIVAENANRENIEYKEELIRVLIHGILHLLGYDHYEEIEREEMFDIQERLLLKIKKEL